MDDQTINTPTEGEETKCTCSETCPDDCKCDKCGCDKEEATESTKEAETETPAVTEEKPAEEATE